MSFFVLGGGAASPFVLKVVLEQQHFHAQCLALLLHAHKLLVKVGGNDRDGNGNHKHAAYACCRRNDAAAHGDGTVVSIANSRHCNDAPPKGVRDTLVVNGWV